MHLFKLIIIINGDDAVLHIATINASVLLTNLKQQPLLLTLTLLLTPTLWNAPLTTTAWLQLYAMFLPPFYLFNPKLS